eukprot:6541990-Ditylum_brightwellii.AAC.1
MHFHHAIKELDKDQFEHATASEIYTSTEKKHWKLIPWNEVPEGEFGAASESIKLLGNIYTHGDMVPIEHPSLWPCQQVYRQEMVAARLMYCN